MDTILFLFLFAGAVALYMLPTVIAWQRDHDSMITIFFVNLLGGWTVLFWLGALIWAAATSNANTIRVANLPRKTPEETVARIPCPHCAELILPAANICKHCGRDVTPLAPHEG